MYTSETKIEDFVQEYIRSRIVAETTVRAVLKRATEYEDLFNWSMFASERKCIGVTGSK